MNAAGRAELAAIRAGVAEMRQHLAQFAKVAGIIYDAGWDDALGRRPNVTNRPRKALLAALDGDGSRG